MAVERRGRHRLRQRLRRRRCFARLVVMTCVHHARASTVCTGDGDTGPNRSRILLLPMRIDESRDQSGRSRSGGRMNPSPWARTRVPAGRLLWGRRALMADSVRCAGRPCASSQGSTISAWGLKETRGWQGHFCRARSGTQEGPASRRVRHRNSRRAASGARCSCCKPGRAMVRLASPCGEAWRGRRTRGTADSRREAKGGCRRGQCYNSCGFWDTACVFLASLARAGR